MGRGSDYAVVRVNDDSFRLDRLTEPSTGATAFVMRARDRLGNPLSWRLRPLAVMQGSKSRLWPTAADAIASTKLLSRAEARLVTGDAAAPATTSPKRTALQSQP